MKALKVRDPFLAAKRSRGRDRLLQTPADCWKHLKTLGGVDEGGYDAELIDAIHSKLGKQIGRSFNARLKDPDVTVEALINGVFAALEPYSQMMTELLAMFEKAAATDNNRASLDVSFDFTEGREPLAFDLASFRKWRRTASRVLSQTREVRWWNHDHLVGLVRILEESTKENRRETVDWLPDRDLATASWPWSVHQAFDIYSRVRESSSNDGSSGEREALPEFQSIDEPAREPISEAWLTRALAEMNWVPRMTSIFDTLDSHPAFWPDVDRILAPLIDSIKLHTVARRSPAEELEAFLSLPLWKFRYELYSAWVGARLVQMMGPRARVHSVKGQIRYSFSATHLASAPLEDGRNVHLMAELRSPLRKPKGRHRSKAVQPDYTIFVDPITDPGSARLVVECKQYKRANAASFAEAISDYGRAREKAVVTLVNYGPVTDGILAQVDPPVADRAHVFGVFRPGSNEELSRFEALLDECIDGRLRDDPAVPIPIDLPLPTVVALTWTGSIDMDLHVWVESPSNGTNHINFGNLGSLNPCDGAELKKDITSGPATEVVSIVSGFAFHCAAHVYSEARSLDDAGASLSVTLAGEKVHITPPKSVDRWWDILSWHPQAGFRIKNRSGSTPP